MKSGFSKKMIPIGLCIIIMLTALICVPFSAAASSVSYSFTGSDSSAAGYAQGTITLNADSGTYYLYWADDSKALDGFDELAKLSVGSSGKATHTMVERAAIPADATKLIAIKSSSAPSNKNVSNAAAVYNIPDSKRLGYNSSQRLYRFEALSDIHIDEAGGYSHSDEHFSRALQDACDREVDFIVTSGDHHNNTEGSQGIYVKEWRKYQQILAQSNYCNPIYEGIGNHELWQGNGTGTIRFVKATGLEGSNGTATKAYYEKTINGDHFIFVALEYGFRPNEVDEFSTKQLDWLEGLLQQYQNDGHNTYIIEHSNLYQYGAGDRTNGTPYYSIPLTDDHPSTVRFKNLLKTYKTPIFISGHTHIEFKQQYNFSDNGGTSCQMIHNSSCGQSRYISNGSLQYPNDLGRSEGYIVDSFPNGIIFHGTNLYRNTIDPNCCYIVKTADQINGKKSKGSYSTGAAGELSGFCVKGTFNNWGSTNPLYTTNDSNIIETTIQLSKGSYEFKIYNGSWYGNNGTIVDTTKTTSNGGWVMSTSEGNCKLTASGGYYTFNFNKSNNKLNLLYSATDPNESTPQSQPSSSESSIPSEPDNDYILGDADGNGVIDINDATAIQLYLVRRRTFDENAVRAADFNGDNKVSIRDVTSIQIYLVSQANLVDITSKLNEVRNTLNNYYTFSSYDCYQALKKRYYADKNMTKASQSELNTLTTLNSDMITTAGGVEPDPTGAVNVYFENTDWSSVYAYCWDEGSGNKEKEWPGKAATYVGKNDAGKSIYRYTVDLSKYNSIIFNNNNLGKQTVDIYLTDNNMAYYLTGSGSPYLVNNYLFKDKYIVG